MAVVEFRTGWAEVPDHIAVLMRSLPTKTMTYDEAVKAMNRKLEDDQVRKAMEQAIGDGLKMRGLR